MRVRCGHGRLDRFDLPMGGEELIAVDIEPSRKSRRARCVRLK